MHEPPRDVTDDAVRTAVRRSWGIDAGGATYLPVGFGAHHWRVGPLFVTLDALGPRHDGASLETAYAGAAALAGAGLEFVVAPVRSSFGTCTVPFAGGSLSATRWLQGTRPADPSAALPLVRRLHGSAPARDLPRWRPLVPASFADGLAERLRAPWTGGPHAEAAHAVLTTHLRDARAWTAEYHRLAEAARRRSWVPTHGEPHERNQLVTDDGLRLVDWESLKLAPVERDLRVLGAHDADPAMLAMFDLEWRLDEIGQYATWFASPHGDTEDDRTALAGLRHELTRG